MLPSNQTDNMIIHLYLYLNVSRQAGPKVVVWYQLTPAGAPHPHDEHPAEEISEK